MLGVYQTAVWGRRNASIHCEDEARMSKSGKSYSRIFCLNRKLSMVLMAALPARNTMRVE